MAISEENKKFIENLIHYYISESASYKQIAEDFIPNVESAVDTAFGIIVGNIYFEFLQAYQNQKIGVNLDDIQEFYKIIKDHGPIIKKAILWGTSESAETKESKDKSEKKEKKTVEKKVEEKKAEN